MSQSIQVDLRISSQASLPRIRTMEPTSTTGKSGPVNEEKLESAKIDWVTNLVAGAMAGALAKSVIAPLDRTKITFQVTKKEFSARQALRFLSHSYRTEGLLSLWRGNSATMARIIPYAAIQFTAHEQWKHVLKTDRPDASTGMRFVSGSLAGVTAQSLTYPLDLARARMAVTPRHMYKSLAQVFVHLGRDRQPRVFYKGFTATILGVIPYAGVSFCTYETLKQTHRDYTQKACPNPLERLLFGALAGLFGQTASYPLDIVRRRMQTSGLNGVEYNSIWGTILHVYREEGFFRGLYKGVTMNWIKGPIAVGISFATFDMMQSALNQLPLFRPGL